MNKYSKKKSIWKTTCEFHPGLICVAIVIIVFIILYGIGFIEKHTLGFSVIEFLFKTSDTGLIDNILTGFITIMTIVMAAYLIYYLTIHQILKQLAIARYCKLPLTAEEIKLGIDTGDFTSVSTYFEYLNQQMSYGLLDDYLISFTKNEIRDVVNNCIRVFHPKDDEYFELPECICTTLMNIYDEEHLGRVEDINDGMFLLHSSVAKEQGIPVTESNWGLYGKMYKERTNAFFEED